MRRDRAHPVMESPKEATTEYGSLSASAEDEAPNNFLLIFIILCINAAIGVGSYYLDFWYLAIYIVGLQWLAGVPSIIYKTEKYYDLTGAFTYTSTMLLSVLTAPEFTYRILLSSLCVVMWSFRLGLILFRRIRRDGEDTRFRNAKTYPVLFLIFWMMQAAWIFITLLPILILRTETYLPDRFVVWDILALCLFLVALVFEAISDEQKRIFRADSANAGQFISTGLWKYSRHPNYFGEIWVWIALYLFCVRRMTLADALISALSPLFIAFLLIFVSGIPLLEKSADKRWGGQPAYEEYKAKTAVLIPFIW